MDEVKERIIEFRNMLTRALDAQNGKQDKYSRGVATVTRTLLRDYDRIFQPSILKQPAGSLEPLIHSHCHETGCPICGAQMRWYEDLSMFVCKSRPSCRGRRLKSLKVWVNDELRMFLTRKEREAKLKEEQRKASRFHNLDL